MQSASDDPATLSGVRRWTIRECEGREEEMSDMTKGLTWTGFPFKITDCVFVQIRWLTSRLDSRRRLLLSFLSVRDTITFPSQFIH